MELAGGPRTTARLAAATIAMATVTLVSPVAAYADTVADYQKPYFTALKMERAHQISQGQGVVVGVVDTGVDATVPDLRGQVLPGRGVGVSGDGRRDADPASGHGTGMAGIIAGRGGGANRALGVAPRSKILPVASKTGRSTADLVESIRWAADNGAEVLNVSLGSDRAADPAEVAAIQYALSRNVVVVASAGNREQGDSRVVSPASIPGVLAVGVTMNSGAAWPGGVAGPEMVLSVPAEEVISPAPAETSSNGYLVDTSTSRAAALVSGIAALVRAEYPDLDAANVVNRLIRTADDRGPKGRDEAYGFGVVDPVAALTADVPNVSANPLLGAAAPATSGAAGSGRNDAEDEGGDDAAVSFSVGDPKAAVLQAGVCLGVVALTLGVVFFAVRRSRRRATGPVAPTPPGWQQPAPGYPPQNYPPQNYPPQNYPTQGYPPQQAHYPPAGNPPPQGYPQAPGHPQGGAGHPQGGAGQPPGPPARP